ncbi:(2Fe-2S) ferredoxin domain-containing protein [Litoribacter ruber]|uniref:(2Fe-2S) ferredoxin domain-containing protein n=1 Tax=Litoribacter ruber TaxID=702568 RepID=A0AAP2CFP8_9BACT|nr:MULTISPECIES: (2Fe-2S) ferredoxin domain-containing protein [Litoribacter]MBS9523142.1 (2Fe-2S) ferredoxin domain-containing protein [Litoribacter alkaliphilus]MBT0810695.1 (2Fe-2S) ferredoxin domain-containing protein [Litoribacter ruber]
MGEYREFVFVCTGSDCKSAGCKKLIGDLKEATKSTYKGRFKIIKTKCMDFCKTGPMVIYKEEVVKKASLASLRELFDK